LILHIARLIMICLMSLKLPKLASGGLRFLPGILVCLAFTLAGCASSFKAETTVFHQWSNHTSSPLGYKFAPVAVAEQTLEREAHLQLVRQALSGKGFRETADGALLLSVTYSSAETRRLVSGDPWIRSSIWAGGVFRSGGVVLGGSLPIGGVPVREVTYWDRVLSLVLTESVGGEVKRVYEGRASSVDAGRDALAALPFLLRALLDDFPGPSGVTREVSLPISR
jgi:Domain of unknown function (DUF4136)